MPHGAEHCGHGGGAVIRLTDALRLPGGAGGAGRRTPATSGRARWTATLDRYREGGWCRVVSTSDQRDRAVNAGLPGAIAHDRRLDRESSAPVVFSPYRPGADPVPLNFDLSFNHLPSAYERPGPVVSIHRLAHCTPG